MSFLVSLSRPDTKPTEKIVKGLFVKKIDDLTLMSTIRTFDKA
jgi:hypothetical protein